MIPRFRAKKIPKPILLLNLIHGSTVATCITAGLSFSVPMCLLNYIYQGLSADLKTNNRHRGQNDDMSPVDGWGPPLAVCQPLKLSVAALLWLALCRSHPVELQIEFLLDIGNMTNCPASHASSGW